MEEVFLREYSLTVGRSAEIIKKTIPALIIRPGGIESKPFGPAGGGFTAPDGSYQDFTVKSKGAITITELRITANITDSKVGKTAKQGAIIEIFNLIKFNQSLIRTDDTVLLRAGYKIDGQGLPLIYAGQVISVTTTKKGQDTITKLICKASEVARKNIKISKVPSRGETAATIAQYFADIAASNGIPTGNVFVPIPRPYPSGYSVAGNMFTAMEEFCSDNELRCYVTLGNLYIEPIDSIRAVTAIEVEAENIKGSIRPQDDSSGKASSQAKQGIEFTLFLDGRITSATVVNIKFGDFRGDYKVLSVKYKLDLEGSAWDTIVSCERKS